MSDMTKFLSENRFRPADIPPFQAKLFYEGERWRPYRERFAVLLVLATIIATAGIIADSTATVIGAMIVAPLMTPIMATAAALVMGDMRRAARSLLVVLGGVLAVIALAWLVGKVFPASLDFPHNSQVTARISPRLIDLIAALASGAAGAFCLSRDDVADSLPGVAIAISLVPPLCVVGLAISVGDLHAAAGALLLFTTNFLSILVAGGAFLAALGLNAAAMIQVRGRARRDAYTAIVIAVVLVAIPLAATGQRVAWETLAERESHRAATAWLAGTPYTVRVVRAQGDVVSMDIVGHGDTPPFPLLVKAVQDAVGRPVVVNLEIVPSQVLSSADTEG